MKFPYRNNSTDRGFTLIELLIVIVIIGILSGVLLTVLNPQQQQQKANETVLRSTAEKLCLSLMTCASTSRNSSSCDTWDEIGVDTTLYNDAASGANVVADNVAGVEPAGATYTMTNYNSGNTGDTIEVTGTLPWLDGSGESCVIGCGYNFATDTVATPFSIYSGANQTCRIE